MIDWIRSLGARGGIVVVVSGVWAVFQLYTGLLGSYNLYIQRGIHLAFGVALVFLIHPSSNRRPNLTLDAVLAVFGFTLFACVAWLNDEIVERLAYVDSIPAWQIALGLCGIAFVIEGARRTVGTTFAILASIFFVYIFVGPWIPGLAGHRGFNLKIAVEHLFYTDEGIFGIPVGVSSTYVYLFVLFGVFLEASGAGRFFLDAVTGLVGHLRGGPAKVALFSSAAMGTISGSAIANVVTTGTFTIPLMKKVGFEPDYAAGVEAMASTGGQITPPIMGVAAFIMAQYSGIPYASIALAAIIPAVLYYSCGLSQIHFHAVRMKVPTIPRSELPDLCQVLRKGWFFITPLLVIVWLLMIGFTAIAAAVYGILTILIVTILFGNRSLLSPRSLLKVFENTARSMLIVIGAVSGAGIIIGSVSLTGLGVSISHAVIGLAAGNQLLALIFTAIVATVLGLGMPTSAAYIISAAVLVPSLIQIGVPVLPAHFFAMFYASLSVITPPVALASYAAASIAGSDPWNTGWKGFKLALAAYIVPFFFVYNQALLGQGTLIEIALALSTGLLGTLALAMSIEGWMLTSLHWYERVTAAIASVLMIFPGWWTDGGGLAILIIIAAINLVRARRAGYGTVVPVRIQTR